MQHFTNCSLAQTAGAILFSFYTLQWRIQEFCSGADFNKFS